MRRSDREVAGEAILQIIEDQYVVRIAMIDEGKPYIVPMNFGYVYEAGRLTLYVHSAREGRKIDSLRKNPVVAFEMDGKHALVENEAACSYSYAYESVMGEGRVVFVEDMEGKAFGLERIMLKQAGIESVRFPEAALQNTCVMKLEVDSMTGKRANLG